MLKKFTHLSLLLTFFSIGFCLAQNNDTIIYKPDSLNDDSLRARVDTLVKSVWNHYTQKDYANTIKVGEKTLELASQINYHKKVTELSSLMGNSFLHTEDTLAAKRIFSRSLADAEKRNDSASILASSIDLGNFYALQEDWKPAIRQYKRALPSAHTLKDTIYLFILNYNIAEANLELNNLKEAEHFISEVKLYDTNLKWATYHAASALVQGKYYFLKKNAKAAIGHLEKSIEISEKENDIEGMIEAYDYYAKAEALNGNFAKAYALREKYDFYKSEQYKIDKIEAIETVTGKFKLNQAKQDLKVAEQQNKINEEHAKREVTIIWSFIAGVLLFGFTLFVLNSNRKRKRLLTNLTLKNKQYLKAKEKSERLTEAKTRMFNTISHELRTPMYGIIGISSLLKEDKTLLGHEENLNSLNFSADYLLSLINNILLLNNLDSKEHQKLKNESFDIRDLIRNVVKSLEFIRTNKSNTIEISISPDVPNFLLGDRVRLSQILINLMSNALKFTEHGLIQLQISKIDANENSVCLHFLVKDSGVGISQEKQKLVFEEFSHDVDGGEYKGTGLGLPIVKKILALHKSELTLRSGIGQGTSLTFAIWYEVSREQTIPPTQNPLLKEKVHLKGNKLLVVDDNKINQLVTQQYLQKLGMESKAANSGEEAIALLKEDGFDLILMDIHMPGMNGFETTEAIRRFNNDIPIIALTAVEIEEVKDNIVSSGMNDFIIKPYDQNYFIGKLYKHLT